MKIRTRTLFLSGITALALTGAACGGSEEPTSAGATGEATGPSIQVSAQDNEFDPTSVEVPKGQDVTIELTNDGDAPHTFTVPGTDADTGTVDPGESATVTLNVDSDTEFVCTIHAESDDMKGQLTVK